MANVAFAEGVMNLITVNTNDPAGYAAWAKKSAHTLVEANGAMAMGALLTNLGCASYRRSLLVVVFRVPGEGLVVKSNESSSACRGG